MLAGNIRGLDSIGFINNTVYMYSIEFIMGMLPSPHISRGPESCE